MAALDKDAPREPCTMGGLDVADLISDHNRTSEVEAQGLGSSKDHARVGLSPRVVCLRERSSAPFVKGTGEDGIDARVGLGEIRDDPLLNADEAVPAIVAATDASLICNDDGCETGPIGPRYCGGRAGNHAHVLGTAEIIGLLYNNAIAVEKQRRPARHSVRRENLEPQAQAVSQSRVHVFSAPMKLMSRL